MKHIIFFFTSYFCSQSLFASNLTLQNAIQNQQISCKLSSTGEHYGKCIQIELQNRLKQPIDIEISPGQVLEIEDKALQNHIITENLIVHLQPNQSQKIVVNGMCIQKNNQGPYVNSLFKLSNLKLTEQEASFAKLIAQNNKQSFVCQQAMWCLQNNFNPNDYINSGDSTTVMQYRKFICAIQKIIPLPYINNYTTYVPHTDSSLEISVNGNWVLYNMKKNDKVSYYIRDENNIIVSKKFDIICTEPYGKISKDKYNVLYDFTATNLNPNKAYYFIIKVNGVVQKEQEFQAIKS